MRFEFAKSLRVDGYHPAIPQVSRPILHTMIRRHSLYSAASLVVAFSVASTLAWGADARIVKKVGNGSASFSVEGGAAQPIAGTGSEIVPEHAQITTGPDVEVYVETFPGAIATVRQNSVVTLQELTVGTKRKARLNLKSGEIVSTIDPSHKNETDYGIITPTGVAAARGTVYAVRVVGNTNTSVGTLSGIVEIDRGPGLAPLRVPFGQMAINSATAQSLAALASSDPSVAADIVSAVQVVATNVGGSLSAAGNAENATGELAAVTSAAIAAVPSQSATIVSSAIRGATELGGATSGSQGNTSNALAAITDAAVRAAVGTNNTQQISTITEAAAATVAAAGRATSANDDGVSAAVSAITSAAVGAAPTQASAAAQGAAKGVIEAKIADAVAAAKSSNPNASSTDLEAVANAAANSAGATAAVSTIATTAVGRELATTGQGNNSTTANSVAITIAAAVNAGSASGASAANNLIASSATVTAPTVTVTVSPTNNGLVVNSTSGTADIHSTATQTVNGNSLTPITTQTVSPTGVQQTVIQPENILPPLDQTQPVVSPSRR